MHIETIQLKDTNWSEEKLKQFVTEVSDFPKKGVLFRDMSPLLSEPEAFRFLVAELSQKVRDLNCTKVIGLESRGFILGIVIAQTLNLPFVAARKAGKLSGETVSCSYSLEYGNQILELQQNALLPADKVAIVDDLLATGGTAEAAATLTRKLGATVGGYFFAIELSALHGRNKLTSAPVESVLKYH